MASKEVAPKRKLRPARKQVEAGDIDKTEAIQPGKEYSTFIIIYWTCSNDQISGTINGLVVTRRMLLPSELTSMRLE